jgi:hypothetical protein
MDTPRRHTGGRPGADHLGRQPRRPQPEACWWCLAAPARRDRVTCSPICARLFAALTASFTTLDTIHFPPPADALRQALDLADELGINHPAQQRHDHDNDLEEHHDHNR